MRDEKGRDLPVLSYHIIFVLLSRDNGSCNVRSLSHTYLLRLTLISHTVDTHVDETRIKMRCKSCHLYSYLQGSEKPLVPKLNPKRIPALFSHSSKLFRFSLLSLFRTGFYRHRKPLLIFNVQVTRQKSSQRILT